MRRYDLICPACQKKGFCRRDIWEDSDTLKCAKCGEWSRTDKWLSPAQEEK
jgi:hypothetical protein